MYVTAASPFPDLKNISLLAHVQVRHFIMWQKVWASNYVHLLKYCTLLK